MCAESHFVNGKLPFVISLGAVSSAREERFHSCTLPGYPVGRTGDSRGKEAACEKGDLEQKGEMEQSAEQRKERSGRSRGCSVGFQAPAQEGAAACILGRLLGSHWRLCGKGVQISSRGLEWQAYSVLLQLSLLSFVGGGKEMERVVVSCIRR